MKYWLINNHLFTIFIKKNIVYIGWTTYIESELQLFMNINFNVTMIAATSAV